jgi:hypothetical protein
MGRAFDKLGYRRCEWKSLHFVVWIERDEPMSANDPRLNKLTFHARPTGHEVLRALSPHHPDPKLWPALIAHTNRMDRR